jgi:hypothetical protein
MAGMVGGCTVPRQSVGDRSVNSHIRCLRYGEEPKEPGTSGYSRELEAQASP